MNKTTVVSARVLGGLAALFAIGGTVLRFWMLQNAYRAEDGFYTDSTLHAILRYSLIALAAIAFLWAHIYIKEGNRPIQLPGSKVVTLASLFTGCVLGGFILYTFAQFVLPMFDMPRAANIIMAVLSALAMLYYFSSDKKGDFRALLCLASALVLLVMIFGLYFNESVSYVNHTIVLCFAALIFTMLSIAAEGNILLGRGAYRRYLSYAPTAVALCLTLSIPDIPFWLTDRVPVVTDVYYDILLFAFGVYHLVKLLQIAMQTAKEEA